MTKEIPPLSESDLSRFWAKVDKSQGFGPDGDCWEWTAGKARGYGNTNLCREKYYSHRVAYSLMVGRIPEGLHVLHHCDNPACVNPDHLWLGTPMDNARDRDAKGRGGTVVGNLHYSRLHPELLARGKRHGSCTRPECTLRGELVVWAKLAEWQVVNIRREYAEGGTTHRKLAAQYGVAHSAIGRIIRRKTWKHI